MEWFYKIFDLFNDAARKVATYLPQSGDDIIQLFRRFLQFAGTINTWIADTLGINFQKIASELGRIIVLVFNFFVDIVKNLVERI